MANPLIPQGTLNRIRCSVVVPSFPSLSITAPYMGKSFATIAFSGSFTELIPTATGGVASPEPYVMATISVGLLRTQSLSASWLAQAGATGAIGSVTIHSDTAAFPEIKLDNCVIDSVEPGAYDGLDPVVRLTLKGFYYINEDLWNFQ